MRRPLLGILRALAGLLAGAGCASAPAPKPFSGDVNFGPDATFIVVGDVQRTSALEVLRERNDPERRLILAEIGRRRPALVVIAGDLVFDGSSARHWSEFDRLTEPLRAANIPVLAVPGNHEYWIAGQNNLKHYFARLPHLEGARWYERRYAPIALVLLDSNRDQMTDADWNEQRCWYEKTLRALDREPSVRGVLVIIHHPPYTNSTVTGDESHVQQAFVPAFVRSDKTLGLISGHVHSYERFERDGKTFLVSGGGGGPRARLKTWSRRHPDDVFQGPALRDFHFLELKVHDAGVHVRVVGLPKNGRAFYEMDSLDLPFTQ